MGGRDFCETTMKMGEGGSAPPCRECVVGVSSTPVVDGVSVVKTTSAIRPTAANCTTMTSACSDDISGDACAAACQQPRERDEDRRHECQCEQTTLLSTPEQNKVDTKRQENIGCTGDISADYHYDCLSRKLERSLSLSPHHSAPVSPRRKKAVRFADALGLDLENVKHFMVSGDPPFVPESATRSLRLGDVPSRFRRHPETADCPDYRSYITVRFSQPGAAVDFISGVLMTMVKVENCVVDKVQMVVNGTVRVANVAYDKHVAVRYTYNDWVTCSEVGATYVPGSNDGPTDRFSFALYLPPDFATVSGSRVEFAVRYDTPGCSRWDNNDALNYVIECYVPSFYVGTKPPSS